MLKFNNKVLLTIFILFIILSLFFSIWMRSSSDSDNHVENIIEDNYSLFSDGRSTFAFEYPKNWSIEKQFSESRKITNDTIKVSSEEGFVITFSSTRSIYDEADSYKSVIGYRSSDYEVVETEESHFIFLKSGIVKNNPYTAGFDNYSFVYQVVDNGSAMSDIGYFKHGEENLSSSQYMNIRISFASQSAYNNWSEYKKSLNVVLMTLKSNSNFSASYEQQPDKYLKYSESLLGNNAYSYPYSSSKEGFFDRDCFVVEYNNMLIDGDLIASLVFGDKHRELLLDNMDIYKDTEYLYNLGNLIETSLTKGDSFKALSVCNLSSKLDFAFGYIYNSETSEHVPSIFFVSEGVVSSYNDIWLYSNSIMGGSPNFCEISEDGGLVSFECLSSFDFNTDQGYYNRYIFDTKNNTYSFAEDKNF